MIYTITLNPAIDYFLGYSDEPTGVQKTSKAKYLPGGKGINASILLNNLGIKNKAIIQSGGDIGKKLKTLLKEKEINYINIDAKGETRINVKANFSGDTIEMNSHGNKIDQNLLTKSLKEKISKMKSLDTLLIMGSLPTGMDSKHLEEIVEFGFSRKLKLVFDISNKDLKKLVKYEPEVIKPNIKELSEMFNVEITEKDEVLKYARKLLAKGAKRVIVSLDKKGSIYVDNNSTYTIEGVKINEVNGSGAGDSMISAFVAGIEQKLDVVETLKLASGAGTATAASEGIASKDKIDFYRNQIRVKGGKNV